MLRNAFILQFKMYKQRQLALNSVRIYRHYATAQQSCQVTGPNPHKPEKVPCPNKGSGRGFYYTLGAVLIGTGAIVAYAKHDEDFREWLRENVPGSDEFIAFVTAEETSHIDYIVRKLGKVFEYMMDEIVRMMGGSGKVEEKLPPCDEVQKPYQPPKSAFEPLMDAKKEPEIYAEQRVMERDEIRIVEETVRKVKEDPYVSAKDLVQLELAIAAASKDAIKYYTEAICALREHADEVYRLVEASVEKVETHIWSQIKKKGLEKERIVELAEDNAKEAAKNARELSSFLDDPDLPGTEVVRATAKRNTEKVMAAIDEAKKTFEQERRRVAITDKYWNKVQEARRHFSEELQILFPNVRLSERNMKLADGEIDLFILYAFQTILYYQKELSKIDTISRLKLQTALQQTKLADPRAIDAAVEAELENERRKIGQEFQKKILTLRAECEKEMRTQLKRQSEAHTDHLVEAMALKEREMERRMQRKVDEQILQEKNNFKMEVAGMIGRLKGLDDVMQKRADQDRKAKQATILWSTCQALEAALRSSPCTSPWNEQLRPLQNEINAIKNAASPGDELVRVVVKSIPNEALTRGVYSEAALRDRFLRVERVARKVALLPDGGAPLPMMLLSYLQSFFIISSASPIPPYELANEPFEPGNFNTFDILQRARYWLDRGDFAQCLRYMNLLKGASRAVAREWMLETRILLETQQAAHTLMAHASASGLAYS